MFFISTVQTWSELHEMIFNCFWILLLHLDYADRIFALSRGITFMKEFGVKLHWPFFRKYFLSTAWTAAFTYYLSSSAKSLSFDNSLFCQQFSVLSTYLISSYEIYSMQNYQLKFDFVYFLNFVLFLCQFWYIE